MGNRDDLRIAGPCRETEATPNSQRPTPTLEVRIRRSAFDVGCSAFPLLGEIRKRRELRKRSDPAFAQGSTSSSDIRPPAVFDPSAAFLSPPSVSSVSSCSRTLPVPIPGIGKFLPASWRPPCWRWRGASHPGCRIATGNGSSGAGSWRMARLVSAFRCSQSGFSGRRG